MGEGSLPLELALLSFGILGSGLSRLDSSGERSQPFELDFAFRDSTSSAEVSFPLRGA